jgi:hypothetical protein
MTLARTLPPACHNRRSKAAENVRGGPANPRNVASDRSQRVLAFAHLLPEGKGFWGISRKSLSRKFLLPPGTGQGKGKRAKGSASKTRYDFSRPHPRPLSRKRERGGCRIGSKCSPRLGATHSGRASGQAHARSPDRVPPVLSRRAGGAPRPPRQCCPPGRRKSCRESGR